jgi:hypothetical protein
LPALTPQLPFASVLGFQTMPVHFHPTIALIILAYVAAALNKGPHLAQSVQVLMTSFAGWKAHQSKKSARLLRLHLSAMSDSQFSLSQKQAVVIARIRGS